MKSYSVWYKEGKYWYKAEGGVNKLYAECVCGYYTERGFQAEVREEN